MNIRDALRGVQRLYANDLSAGYNMRTPDALHVAVGIDANGQIINSDEKVT